jgi:hypothetical protein
MKNHDNIRWGWLKAMYILTAIGAGSFGIGIIYSPDLMLKIFGWPVQDMIVFGISGSVYLAFAVLALFGLQQPLRFAPVLLLQFIYKVLWIFSVAVPLMINNQFPAYGLLHLTIFIIFITGDLIAIPFSQLLEKNPDKVALPI